MGNPYISLKVLFNLDGLIAAIRANLGMPGGGIEKSLKSSFSTCTNLCKSSFEIFIFCIFLPSVLISIEEFGQGDDCE